jgi:pimeloyl-ACP methyl ester carboxylesterase
MAKFNIFTRKHWFIKMIVLIMISFSLIGKPEKTHTLINIEDMISQHKETEYVILLHGMFRSAIAMRPAELFLKEKGFKVINLSYPSTKYNIETLVQNYLLPEIISLEANGAKKIHFVTHSMGGILVRHYLKNNPMPSLGRVVMLSPPNKGTELTKLFADTDWFKDKIGPAGKQLNPSHNSWVNQLGSVDFELGIIAGNYNGNLLTSWLLPGPDDGVVSVESMKVTGMADLLLVSEKHFNIRRFIPALQQSVYFIENGRFYQ